MMEQYTCHGCGYLIDECDCENIDAEMNDGKYPDDDPNDGNYNIE